MSEEKYYWKWKNTIIDFNNISDEKDEYSKYMTKKDIVFHYLGTPDEDIHEWYNGGYSSEYNTALRYAKELGLVEDYIDYEDEIYKLKEGIRNIIFQLKHNPRENAENRDKYIIEQLQKLLESQV